MQIEFNEAQNVLIQSQKADTECSHLKYNSKENWLQKYINACKNFQCEWLNERFCHTVIKHIVSASGHSCTRITAISYLRFNCNAL